MVEKDCYGRDYFEGEKKTYRHGYATPQKEQVFARYLTWIEKVAPMEQKGRALDLGCAYGIFLRLLDDRGLETHGIDISEHAVGEAQKYTRAKLTVTDIEEGIPYPDDYFRLVSAFDIIEHIRSPEGLLGEANRVLEKGGCLALTTPNTGSVMKLLQGRRWHGFTDPTHIHFFSRASLGFLLGATGYQVCWMTTPFHPLPLPLSNLLGRTGLGGQIFVVSSKL
jgi:SAM-dependent methyltransferase